MIFAEDLFNVGYFEGHYDRSKIKEEFFRQEIQFIDVDTVENFRFPWFYIENMFFMKENQVVFLLWYI